MSRSVMALAASFVVAFGASAQAREKEANTPSGRPEMVFAYTSLSDAVSQVSSTCMDRGWMVSTQINNQVVCEIPMGIFQSAMTQMLIGNRYSSPPKSFVRFSLGQVGDHTRVQAQAWSETQMAFGQMQHHQYQDDGTYNNLLGFLAGARAQFPVGTTFTSHAYLGVSGENSSWQNGRRSQYGWKLLSVTERGPAYKMGVRAGDILAKINNRTFQTEEDVAKHLDRQRVGQSLKVTVLRDGQELTFEGIAEGRPTITTLVRPSEVPSDALPVALQYAAAHAGSVEAALGGEVPPSASQPKVEEGSLEEDELTRRRREAAEAQARLEEAEARVATEAPGTSSPKP